ncbi:MAG: alpha/beta hydrolase [Pararobbsia sp.]
MSFTGFADFEIETPAARVHGLRGGEGPPLLLIQGATPARDLWAGVARRLCASHTVIALHPADAGELATHRTLAASQADVMASLGFDAFMVCAHGEGARVAQRLALDHPARIERMMVLDITPTLPGNMADDAGGDAATPDNVHARIDAERGRRIVCPVRVLWAAGHDTAPPSDGPLEAWRRVARDTSGRALPVTGCVPREAPEDLFDEMRRFFDTRAC